MANRLSLLALLAALPLAATAQMYRWVDRDGRVHYTQVPPTGQEYESLGPARPPAAAPNQEALNQALEAGLKQDAERQAAAEKAELAQAQRQERCRAAMERLAYLESRPPRRLARTDEQGNVSRLTEEEHAQRIAEQQAAVKENCE